MVVARQVVTILALVLASRAVLAEKMFLKAKTVVVTGVADLQSAGSEAAARDVAIRNAQRNAIEQVVGALVESAFSAEQKETIAANQAAFTSNVEDKVYAQSSGFIESYKILSEGKKGASYAVELEAVVKADTLENELKKLDAVLAAADHPKVMLILTERYTNQAGAPAWIERPSIVPAIESRLLGLGFELVAKDQADELRAQGMAVYAEVVGTPEKAAEVAAKFGAEVIITGSSEVKFSAFNELGNNMYYVSSVVNLRAVSASTAKILASFEGVGKGAGVNEDLARVAAVKQVGPKVVDDLLAALVQAWQAEAAHGKRYKVVVLKVPNYRSVARPFIAAMKKVPDVETVKELSFGGKRLELEVIFKGKKDELLDAIFEHVGEQKKFRKLDKVGDRGDSIELTL